MKKIYLIQVYTFDAKTHESLSNYTLSAHETKESAEAYKKLQEEIDKAKENKAIFYYYAIDAIILQ